MVPGVGLEPTRSVKLHRILSPARMPFRHPGRFLHYNKLAPFIRAEYAGYRVKKLLVLLFLLILGYGAYYVYTEYFKPEPSQPTVLKTTSNVQIGDAIYQVELADTDNERSQGLSGRESLGANRGMLFIFDTKDLYAFWMKDMLFPIDIVWIEDAKIVDLTENVPVPVTATYLPKYQPKSPVDKVLELEAGEIKKQGFTVGQQVTITIFQFQDSAQ